jgi:hypothetical protein
MTIFFCPEFLRDLTSHGDANFPRRVLSKILTNDGGFAPDSDDHPYKGVPDLWIRYVSAGNSAYRAIFVRKGVDIYWYRAGEHSVENNLRSPATLAAAVPVAASPIETDVLGEHTRSRYLKSSHPRLLRELIGSRRLVPHKTLTMVSPRISLPLVAPTGDVGRLIDSVFEFGGAVSIITRPPGIRSLDQYNWLAARGVELLIHETVNARLFCFEVDREQLSDATGDKRSIAVVGSAEITNESLNISSASPCEEELCYEIGEDDFDGSHQFIYHLVDAAVPFAVYRASATLKGAANASQ